MIIYDQTIHVNIYCATKQLAARSPFTTYKAQGYSVQRVISITEQMSALFRNRRHSRKASVSLEK